MNTRLLMAALTLAATTCAAQATTADRAPMQAATAKRAASIQHAPKHHASRAATQRKDHALRPAAEDRLHKRAVLAREAEQKRWIDNELRLGRLNADDAGALRSWVVRLADRQASLTRRGHETVDQALAISHEQDLLDWAIRTGRPDFEPPHRLASS